MGNSISTTPELDTSQDIPKDWMKNSLVMPLINRGLNLMQSGAELIGYKGRLYGVDPTEGGIQAGVPIDLGNAQTFTGFRMVNDLGDMTLGLLINSANASLYAGRCIPFNSAGGQTLTIDASAGDGFNCSILQRGAGQVTVAVTGGLVLTNFDGFTKTAGIKAWCCLMIVGSQLLFGGRGA